MYPESLHKRLEYNNTMILNIIDTLAFNQVSFN